MKKTILISEQQYNSNFLVNEAALPSFSLEALSNIRSFRGKMKYCQEQLGRPQGRGSGRIIYQIDDEKVLKLAMNDKGIAQNLEEGQDDYYKASMSIFPKVYDHDKDFNWIISEFVLPAKPNDFKECFGISMETFFSFIATLGKWYRPEFSTFHHLLSKNEMEELLENEYLQDYLDFIGNYTQYPLGDMLKMDSYGMALRDGEPVMVLLDSGLSDSVYKQYYSRKSKTPY